MEAIRERILEILDNSRYDFDYGFGKTGILNVRMVDRNKAASKIVDFILENLFLKEGDSVICIEEHKNLPKNSIGIINGIFPSTPYYKYGWASVTYPQYYAKEDEKGRLKFTEFITSHSVCLTKLNKINK